MKISIRTVCAAGLIVALSSTSPRFASASGWNAQWDSPKSVLERSSPSQVRAVLEDSSAVLLENPRVIDNHLEGTVGSRRESVPFSSINHLEVRRGSGLGLAAGISLLLLGGVIGLFAATWD